VWAALRPPPSRRPSRKLRRWGRPSSSRRGTGGPAHEGGSCAYPSSSQYAVAVGGTALELGPGSAWKKRDGDQGRRQLQQRIRAADVADGHRHAPRIPVGDVHGTRDTRRLGGVVRVERRSGNPRRMLPLGVGKAKPGAAGGTSLSAPIWTAATAVWNHNNAAAGRPGVGFVDPLLYALGNDPVTYAHDFHDVTAGPTGSRPPKAGMRRPAGGSPNFTNLANNQADPFVRGSPSKPSTNSRSPCRRH